MKQRLITAICLIAVIFPVLIIGGILFDVLAVIAAVMATREILNLVAKKWDQSLIISCYVIMVGSAIAMKFDVKYSAFVCCLALIYLWGWLVFDENVTIEQIGLFYMFLMILSLTIGGFYRMYSFGNLMVFYMVGATVLTDTGAYLIGRMLGKRKLNERISPNKTIEGALGGVACCFIFCMVFGIFVVMRNYAIPLHFIIVSALLLPVTGQIGDLTFSAIKRHYGIKDFSNLFPGHGGVMDRLDSISFNCMLLYALMIIIL